MDEQTSIAEGVKAGLRHDLRNRFSSIRNASYYLMRQVRKTDLWQADPRVESFFQLIERELAAAEELLSARSLALPSAEPGAVVPCEVAAQALEHTGAPRRSLLLVEDDPSNGLTLSALLEEAGFTVVVAESCMEVARRLEEQARYDVVLLDSRLGDGDGRGLIPLIRRQLPEARLVLVSGQASAEAGAPVEAVFQKGESAGELLECLERLLRRERS
jgi:CheY-like chemotaxis protein